MDRISLGISKGLQRFERPHAFSHIICLGTLMIPYSKSVMIFVTGVLVNLHHSGGNNGLASGGSQNGCGLINLDAIQQVVAAKWAVDVINNQSLPHELRIGKL